MGLLVPELERKRGYLREWWVMGAGMYGEARGGSGTSGAWAHVLGGKYFISPLNS